MNHNDDARALLDQAKRAAQSVAKERGPRFWCRLRLHTWTLWEEVRRGSTIDPERGGLITGRFYDYRRTCVCCGRVQHRQDRV